MSKPFKDTLYIDCLFECIEIARERGEEKVEFEDVDLMVVEKSKSIIEYKMEKQ